MAGPGVRDAHKARAIPHAGAGVRNHQVPHVLASAARPKSKCAAPQAPGNVVLDGLEPPHLPGLCQVRPLFCGPAPGARAPAINPNV
eukprot:gene14923-biopygen3629